MTTDELWEALKHVAGANPDKTKIKSLTQIRRHHVKEALELLRVCVPSGKGEAL
jgi:hypothetical protein